MKQSIVTVVDWSHEQGAKVAPVDIPQDPKEMKRLVRRLRKVAVRRLERLKTETYEINQEAERLSASGHPHLAEACWARVLMITYPPIWSSLTHLCRPKIRRNLMDSHVCWCKLTQLKNGHAWMAALETMQKDTRKMALRPGTARLY
jgi:predicted phosphohydrolase